MTTNDIQHSLDKGKQLWFKDAPIWQISSASEPNRRTVDGYGNEKLIHIRSIKPGSKLGAWYKPFCPFEAPPFWGYRFGELLAKKWRGGDWVYLWQQEHEVHWSHRYSLGCNQYS